MIRRISFLLALLSVTSICHGQWSWVHPLPQGNNLNDISFPVPEIGYSVGDHGTVLKSTNNGINWWGLGSITTKDLMSVFFIDAETGFACGHDGTIIKTGNGGESWQLLESNTTKDLRTIFFINEDRGFVAGYDGTFCLTEDGGLNWHSIPFNDSLDFRVLEFPDSTTGYLLANNIKSNTNYLFVSNDTGNTWDNLPLPDQSVLVTLADISFLNQDTGWIVGSDETRILTMDGGASWTLNNGSWSYYYSGVDFWDYYHGYIVGFGTVIHTANGGNNWNSVSDLHFSNVEMTGPDNAFMVGYHGAIYNRQQDTMYNRTQGRYDHMLKIFIPGDNLVYICSSEALFSSTDNGNTYTVKEYDLGTYSYDIEDAHFCDANLGYLLSWGGEIYRTTDGGDTWTEVQSKSRAQFWHCLFMVNENLGFAGGGGYSPGGAHWSSFIKTENGINWSNSFCPSSYPISHIYFLDENFGFISNYSSQLYKTSDGGSSWSELETGTGITIRSMYFFDENRGFAAGGDGQFLKILETQDGGSSWKIRLEKDTQENYSYLDRIYFIDGESGYATGSYGIIMKTEDGGTSWIDVESITSNSLTDIAFINPGTGLACGSSGTIIKYTDPSWIIENPGNSLNTLKCYPNPFNSELSLSTFLSEGRTVSIRLFSLNGKEISRWSINVEHAGDFCKILSLDELPQGMYFIQLKTNYSSLHAKVIKSH